ncbi:MAG: cyclic beta 1-2 glucan synthetase, partial [Planctomycetes bacterium]|nr:cyclic beta 1-2 glucan synthetase [Planctomycetota bacterium]
MNMFETIRKVVVSVWGRRPGASGLEAEAGEPPLRQELFGLALLESHARALANMHELVSRPGRELLLPRLDENEEIIRRSYEDIAKAIRRGRPVAPAAEWLLDNYYLIEEQIDQIRSHFPPGYSRALPRLRSGDMQGFPRVYDLAMELVSHTDGGIDLDNISHVTKAYQDVHTLRLGELWAIPIMVALALIENLRRVAHRVAWRRRLRDLALQWAGQFLRVVQEEPKTLITVLADFVRSNPPMSAPFLAELTANLQGTHPALGLVIDWMDHELAERGQTLELIQQAESHDQAADHVSIGNSITSLRNLSTIDWRDFVESLSAIEAVLRRDPVAVHAQMDFRSRDRCRREVEDLARRSRQEEQFVAQAVVRLARERLNKPGVDRREATTAYFLLDEGRFGLEAQIGYRPTLRRRIERLLRRRALPVYICTIGILTALTAAPLVLALVWAAHGWTGWVFWTIAVLLLLPATRTAVSLTNWAITLLLPPRGLLRLDLSKGIPPDHRTAVIVPAFLSSSETVIALLEHLEIRYLANRSPNLVMVLISDFPDTVTETTPADQPVLEATLAGVRQLNAQYGEDGRDVFYLLHRPRLWNPGERRWMAYERKRGKVEQFNRLVRTGNTSPFSVIEGQVEGLRGVRYVITMDADTDLPPQSVWQMVGAMAHPLNRPVLDRQRRCVVRGYGVLQPRLAVSLAASQRSSFARLFAGDVGLDPYTREVSNVHHELFGEGQFVGKGIYDVEAFDVAAGNRFPENRILSHDLIEGCYARCGFLNDVEVLEDHPSRYLADASRRRRWARGDWQIARWLLPTVPGPDGASYTNPLGPLARWMIFDNLRRTLVPAGLTATFVLVWLLLPAFSAAWTLLILGLYFLPDCARSLRTLCTKAQELYWMTHLRHAAMKELRGWAVNLLDLLLAPFHAVLFLGAVWLTGWRLWVSHRRLLEWQTAADAENSARTSLAGTYLVMWPMPALALLLGVWSIALVFPSIFGACLALPYMPRFPVESIGLLIVTLPVAAAWLLAPALAWLISRPPSTRTTPLKAGQRAFLHRLARRTWSYFDHLAGPENHWLPPDNIQEDPPIGQAYRTSPTNIGMLLLGNLAALDFGYLCPGQLLDRTDKTFRTLEDLPRHRGHFYNWYNTRSLQPALPRYISTADSGNFQATVIVLQAGLAEQPDRPILSERWREGLEDAVGVLMEAAAAPAEDSTGRVARAVRMQIEQALAQPLRLAAAAPATLEGAHSALAAIAGALAELEPALSAGENVLFWVRQLRRQCEDWRDEIAHLAPWVATGAGSGGAAESSVHLDGLDGIPSLRQLASWSGAAMPATGPAAETATDDEACGASALRALSAERAAVRLAAIEDLQGRCSELAEMDFTFLYDPSRNLLAIGYNLDTHRRDPGLYDLLASEARLCSFVSVARGQLPLEHWFHLGRQLAPGGERITLVSWSGSM